MYADKIDLLKPNGREVNKVPGEGVLSFFLHK